MINKLAFTFTFAALSPWLVHAQSLERLEILSGWPTKQGTLIAGLTLKLSQGWKTYWRSPGAAGFPPEIDFSGSKNIQSAKILWPKPEVFGTAGFETLGYHGTVTWPIEIVPTSQTDPVNLVIRGNIGICDDICVPIEFELSKLIETVSSNRNAKIAAALAQLPWTMADFKADPIHCEFSPTSKGISISIDAKVHSLGTWERVAIEYPDPEAWLETQSLTRSGNNLGATVLMTKNGGAPSGIDRSQFVISLIGSDQSIEQTGCE